MNSPPASVLLGAAFEALNEGVMLFNADVRLIYANPAAARLLGKPAEELVRTGMRGWLVVDVAGNEIPLAELPAMRVAVSGLPVSDLVVGARVEPAGRRWLRLNGAPIHDGERLTGVVVSFIDVTESRQVSAALRSQETINRQLMDALADGVFVAQDFRFVHANPALTHMLGYEHDDFVGLPFDRVVPPEKMATWRERYIQRVGSGPEPARAYETSFLHADGRRVELELVATRTTYGERRAVLGVVREISERKRLDAELARRRLDLEELVELRTVEARIALELQQETETFARLVTDNLNSPIAYLSSDMRLLFANVAWLDWFGLERETAIGRPIVESLGRSFYERWRADIEKVLAGESSDTVTELTSASGETRFLRVSRQPDIREGVVRGYFTLATDLTEQQRASSSLERANAALAEAERFTRAVADTLPVRIAYWDRELRCRFVNRAQCDWFGKPPEQWLGFRHDEVFTDPEAPRRAAMMQKVLDGQRQELVRESVSADGKSAIFQVFLTPDRSGDAVAGVLVLAIDITLQQRAQAALEQTNVELAASRDRAEAGARAKSAFLANMSHEIRTPMNAIIGLTHLLRRDTLEPQAGERLGRVADAAQHLLQIVDDILDLSKIEAGKVEIEAAAFDASAMLERCCALVAAQADAKGLRIALDAEGVPRHLVGDATRLTQSLVNLLGNAVKFSESGPIEVRARSEPVDGDDGAFLLRLAVTDHGIGIEPERLPMLFTAFEQADASTTRRFGGTGLGLALTRHLARLMGGDAGATSTPGLGSTFWITARVRRGAVESGGEASSSLHDRMRELLEHEPDATRAPKSDRHAEHALRERHAGARILLAEDNLVNQEVATALLEAAGLVVEVAEDGVRAVEMVLAASYDLILMDMQMPHVDGLQATRAIRRLSGRTRLPIVAMTANAFSEDRRAALAAGMDDHITKPVDPAVLYETLSRWLDLRRQAAAAPPASGRPDGIAALDGAEPADEPATDAFAGIEGLDVATGLAFFADSDATYRIALGHFARLYGQGLPAHAGTVPAIVRELHGVAGASATVGAAPLANRARALHDDLRDTDESVVTAPVRQQVDAFSADLARLANVIAERLGAPALSSRP